jgi:hypothetical protein
VYQWNWDVSGDKATLDNIRGFESLTPSNGTLILLLIQ